MADHMCFLIHRSGSTQEQNGAPLEKSLQSHEDHEMPTEQPGLRQNAIFSVSAIYYYYLTIRLPEFE